jgi:transcriptional regulator with XRE-family HTH domain
LFDKVEIDWQGNRGLSEPEFAKLLGIARQEFGEIKIDQALTGFSNETIDKYMEARDATLTRLQSVTEELLFGIHKRQHELDEQFQQRIDVLNTQTEERRKALQNQHEERQAALGNQESDLKKRLAEFETNESKYLRRQLRRDMLQVLEGFKSKFEVTAGTRNLRWPVMIFSLTMLVGFGTLMSVSFYQSFKIFGSPDISKINTVGMIVLATKQLGLTAAFVGVAWFFIRWNDRWFRQHADAEFMFKRLGLDINRASWVVEMAMEWKAEKGTDIPTELLDRLTRNLFKEVSGRGDEGEAPPTVADIILGSAATVKIKTAGGTEIDLDRKGLQKALSQGTD